MVVAQFPLSVILLTYQPGSEGDHSPHITAQNGIVGEAHLCVVLGRMASFPIPALGIPDVQSSERVIPITSPF